MESNNSLERRTENFIRAPKVIGNTILGAALGAASLMAPDIEWIYSLSNVGFNAQNRPESNEPKRLIGEIIAYTTYCLVIKESTYVLGQYLLSK